MAEPRERIVSPPQGRRGEPEGSRSGLRRLLHALERAAALYPRHYCPQMAAAISYHVLFSLVPLLVVLVAILGLVLQNERAREDVVAWLLDVIPLSEGASRTLERAVGGIATPASAAGVVALAGLAWSASAMMGAIRTALGAIFGGDVRRPLLRGKAVDLALVAGAGLLALLSFGLTVALRVAERASAGAADVLGAFGSVVTAAGNLVGILVPLGLTLATCVLLYRYVPLRRPRFGDLLPGAVLAACAVEALKTGFAVYIAHLTDYNAIYGSLGAVLAFLFFVYLAASALLFGAELAAAWPAAAQRSAGGPPSPPLRRRIRALVLGLWRHEQQPRGEAPSSETRRLP